nr:hypothetical protein Iba_chr08aCG9560 [Ipomoea batatas]
MKKCFTLLKPGRSFTAVFTLHSFKASPEASPNANQARSMESGSCSNSPFRKSYLYPLSPIAKAALSPSLAALFRNFPANNSQSFHSCN